MRSIRNRSALSILILLVAPIGVAGQARVPSPRRLREVIIVHKTHFDIGYTGLARDVIQRYRTTMIDKALDIVDRSRNLPPEQRFVWTIPGWPMSQILWHGQTPERRERVLSAVRSGQFVTHALPFTTHTESLDLEDLVRGLEFSSRLARTAGIALPRDAKLTDVPSHSWVIPTLLRHAGVEFLYLGSNRLSSTPDLPEFWVSPENPEWNRQSLFWWEGPDGSRLLTMYSSAYGSSLFPPVDWPYQTWLALIHTSDNAGPPTPESVRKLLDQAKEQLPGVRIRFGRLSDFADAILKENPNLPVVKGDMPDAWIHGIGSMPAETALARNTRPRIAALEALNTQLGIWLHGQNDAATVAAAYEQTLLYGEHTWGLDAMKFPRTYGAEWEADRSAGKFVNLEASWTEHGSYARRADKLVGPRLESNLKALSRSVRVPGTRVAVFNPLPWSRDGVVEIATSGASPSSLRDAESGVLIPAEVESDRVRFIAGIVPPMGYRTYIWTDQPTPAAGDLFGNEEDRIIENAHLRVKLDPERGRIASVVAKRGGRELVDGTADFGFGQYIHESFSADDLMRFVFNYSKPLSKLIFGAFGKPNMPPASEVPYRAIAARGMSMRLRRGPVSLSAVMQVAAGESTPNAVSLEVTLYSGQPYLDVAWRVTDKKATPWPEGGWLAFPIQARNPEFRLARLGAIIDPAKDTIRGTNHEVYCLNGGMAVLEAQQRGVALCPLDSPLVSLDHPGLLKYSKEFCAKKPHVFVNLYNNVWGSNFAQWNSGSWTSRVRLWTLGKYNPAADLVRPSQEARFPLMGAFVKAPAGSLEPLKPGLRVSRPGVIVTAWGKNPDGPGLLLRLWEQAGQDGAGAVCLPRGMSATSAQPVDLRGRNAGKPVPVQGGCFTVQLRRNSPISFLLPE